MLRQGQSLKHIKGDGPPLKSPTLGAVVAAITSGLKFSGPDCLLDMLRPGKGEEVSRSFVWSFDGDSTCTFEPAFQAETIDLNELVKRFMSDAWCKANPHHPIAFMRCFFDMRNDLVAQVVNRPRMEVIERESTAGRRSMCFIPENATPEERAQLLADFEK